MRESKEIDFLLQGNQRLWDMSDWFKQTVDFIISDMESLFQEQCIKQAPPEDTRIIAKISKKLFSINSRDFESFNNVKVGVIFYKTREYVLAEKYLKDSLLNIDKIIETCDFCPGLINYLLAKIQIEKTEYRKANNYFLKSYKSIHSDISFFEKIEFFLQWSSLFTESGYFNYAEKILNLLSANIPPQISPIYAHILFGLFILSKKMNQTDIAVTYANILFSCPVEYLDFDDWYTIHLFCGEYNSSIKRSFDKAIFHFTQANSFLSYKWKEYLREISLLKDILKLSDYLSFRITYEDKMQEIILENNLHSSHYLNSLKNAYKELECIYEKVQEYSMTDSLTGLHNRRYLWKKMGELVVLAYKQKVPISCLMIDFDDFKLINDSYGHIEGDKVIKTVCNAIKAHFRKSDIVIRFGGEEILILMLNASKDNALRISEKLRTSIEDLIIMSADNQRIKLTISIGVSTIEHITNTDTTIIEELIDNADKFMYNAKKQGKNRIYLQE